MKLDLKIIYSFEDEEYIVFVDRIKIEGYGKTEQEAIQDFIKKFELEKYSS